jgi:Mce-associated membrane protein
VTETPKDEELSSTAEEAPALDETPAEQAPAARRPVQWSRVFAYGVLPVLALVLAAAGGYLFWRDMGTDRADQAREDSVGAARSITIAMLTYEPNTVEQQLGAAKEQLTGGFRDTYSSMIDTVVVPGAKEQQITAITDVPAAASVTADADHAVVLLFVNQTVTVGESAPSSTASSVRVTLDKVGEQWLVSEFQPI